MSSFGFTDNFELYNVLKVYVIFLYVPIATFLRETQALGKRIVAIL